MISKKFYNYLKYYIVILIAFNLIFISMGQINRWDLLEQVSMADNYIKNGYFYPNPASKDLFGTSIYFPGVAFLSLFFIKIIPDSFVIEFLYLIAILFIFLLLHIQRHLIQLHFKRFSELKFYIFTVFSFFLINNDWLLYACEFKPDTIAFSIGAIGLIIANVDKDNKEIHYPKFILGFLLTGLAICFKQQYVSFILGLLIFSIIKENNKLRIFTILTIITTLIFLAIISNIPFQWFWNISILQDDGLLTAITVIKNNSNLIPKIFFYLVFIYVLNKSNFLNNIKFKHHFLHSPWLVIVISVLFFSFLSSIKVGGNAGNTEFGLVLLFPFTFFSIKKIVNIKFVYIFVFIFSLYTIFNFNKKIEHYLNYRQSIDFVEKLKSKQDRKILTGSNVYGVSRIFNENANILNLNTYSLLDDKPHLIKLEELVNNDSFDLIIIDNDISNFNFMKSNCDYEIIFRNNIVLVAKNVEN
jgi:hypothetical protein